MATFSTNQNRQLYVAKHSGIQTPAVVGDIAVAKQDDCLYFKYIGADGKQVRSDLIPVKSISYAKATSAASMAHSPKAVAVEFKSGVTSVKGQTYIVNVNYKAFVGIGEENTYLETASVVAKADNANSAVLKGLALNLAKNTAKQGLVKVYLQDTSDATHLVTKDTTDASLSGTYDALLIVEKEQDWILGTKELTFVDFSVVCPPVDGEYGISDEWADVDDITADALSGSLTTAVGNGKAIADLEYFCMGERADQYRKMGWPNAFDTKYLVDPATTYDVIDIHFAYQGSCEDIQKSEKDITIVCPSASHTVVNALISAINTAAAKEILIADKDTALVDTTTGKPLADIEANVAGDLLSTLS